MNKKRFLISLATIGAVAAIALAATGALFSDTETSTDNALVAGALDLEVDNTCYYNGRACIDGFWGGEERVGNECSCSWKLKSLEGELFFDLHDLKPGDWEEDTISLHADNDYWACLDMDLTEDDDNGCTEPELIPDRNCDSASKFDGELGDALDFIFWVDDGDNVLEEDESLRIFERGSASAILDDTRWTLADSKRHPFAAEPGPLLASHVYYIGKVFCFGELKLDLKQQDRKGAGQNNGPDVRGPGITCDGSKKGNITQTDKLVGNIVLQAEQARHNDGFLCKPLPTPTPTPSPTLFPLPT